MSDKNNRRHTRVPYKNCVVLVLQDKEYSGCKTENLSLRGVFLPEILGPLDDEEGELKLELDRKNKIVITAGVRVVRADDSGVALEFISVDTDSFFHLKRVVMYNSDDPDSVAEEPAK